MSHRPYFTAEDAQRIGESLGITWEHFDVEQFRLGLDVELERRSRRTRLFRWRRPP